MRTKEQTKRKIEYNRQWRANNRDKKNQTKRSWYVKNRDQINQRKRENHDPEKNRNQHLKYLYDMTLEEFNDLLVSQHNSCAGCGTLDPGKRGWFVDHDHKTEEVRGILCLHCNTILGYAHDDPVRLELLALYLRTKKEGA